jgi:hypothetical protein
VSLEEGHHHASWVSQSLEGPGTTPRQGIGPFLERGAQAWDSLSILILILILILGTKTCQLL